jgi:hypothetical protein
MTNAFLNKGASDLSPLLFRLIISNDGSSDFSHKSRCTDALTQEGLLCPALDVQPAVILHNTIPIVILISLVFLLSFGSA